jgi:hypothetical protein
MTTDLSPDRRTRDTRPRVIPVLVVGLAPLAWAVHLSLTYWFVPVTCGWGTVAPMHVITVAAVAVSLFVAYYGWRGRRLEGAGELAEVSWAADLGAGRVPVALARLAHLLGMYFAFVIVMTGLVAVIVDPCA